MAFGASRGLAVLACLGATAAAAQDLRVAVSAEVTSIDPHFHNLGPNNALRRHVFEALVATDQQQRLVPALAASWRALDERTWEFKLRAGAKFSNGTPFTARDVVYSLCRVPTVENSPSSFTIFTRGIEDVATPDPETMLVRTEKPLPLLPNNLSGIGIVSAEAFGGAGVVYKPNGCENLGTPPRSADFNDPAKAIGTGPFRLAGYARGAQVVLERHDGYWGAKPRWRSVTFRPLPAEGARVAALLAGDVDLIENPPIGEFARIRGAGFEVSQGISSRVIYLAMDQFRGEGWRTPGIRGTDRNPLLDHRVREAFSKAIDREAIVAGIMGGVARAAGELLPPPLFGSSPEARPDPFDPDAARRLLAEAGYADGFEITLGTPNDRYINDERVALAVAEMLGRVGIRTTVDAMTASTFFTRRNRNEFSLYLAGWGTESGEMSNPLNALVLTPNPQAGYGSTNRGRYSNPRIDALVIEARRTIDEERRVSLLREASKLAMADYAVVPLHFEATSWAFRRELTYKARVDQHTLATEVKVVGQ
jgi:peptide/nickel transport system substrate-binding protein